jgi:hypothetical protein
MTELGMFVTEVWKLTKSNPSEADVEHLCLLLNSEAEDLAEALFELPREDIWRKAVLVAVMAARIAVNKEDNTPSFPTEDDI